MIQERRHALIVASLRRSGPLSVAALAETVGASEATIRRDLVLLDREGEVRRVHGGAAPRGIDDPFDEVSQVHRDAKEDIAAACAALVQDGETVLIDIGTTAHLVARALRGRPVTVVTSSLAVVTQLADDDATELIILGGQLRREYRSMVGSLTLDALRQVRADRLILGTSGVSAAGEVMDTTVVEVPLKRAMIAASGSVVLAADSAKFPGRGVAMVCPPGDLDIVVTDAPVPEPTSEALSAAGVRTVIT